MPSTRAAFRSPRAAVLTVIGAIVIGSCLLALSAISMRLDSPGQDFASFWAALRIDADEAEGFTSLEEMHARSDAVIVGRLTSFEVSRVLQGDAAEDRVGYAVSNVEILEQIRGGSLVEPVRLEFLLTSGSPDFEAQVKAAAADVPTERVVLFLRAKRGSAEAGLFRVVNSKGLWAETMRAPIDAPLSVEAPFATGLYGTELRDVRTIDDFVALLRSYGG